MKKRLALFLMLLVCGQVGYSQEQVSIDTLCVEIFFRHGYSTFEPGFCNNEVRLEEFVNRVQAIQQDSTCQIKNISVQGAASPDGSSSLNARLATKRAENIVAWMKERFSFSDVSFTVSSVGVDWVGLAVLVEASDMPYRDEVLDILRNTPENVFRDGVLVDSRKRQLGMLHGGRAWFYMEEHFFPAIRNGRVTLTYEVENQPVVTEPVPEEPAPVVEPEPAPEEQPSEVEEQPAVVSDAEDKPFYMALKTNLLYDVALVPNIGAEFYLGRGWTIGASWMYAWWKNDNCHLYWRTYGGELDVRKYFGRRAAEKPLTGHHLGLYGQALTYDFELGGKGYQSKLSYGVGIEYGYSLPIGRRLNLDFVIGVGYLGGEYKTYVPIDTHYVWQSTRQRHWFGPTKAEISLVWLIGRGNYNEKGGKR